MHWRYYFTLVLARLSPQALLREKAGGIRSGRFAIDRWRLDRALRLAVGLLDS